MRHSCKLPKESPVSIWNSDIVEIVDQRMNSLVCFNLAKNPTVALARIVCRLLA